MKTLINKSYLYRGLASPNPTVGAAVVNQAQDWIGFGVHTHYGAAHAERKALAQAGKAAQGATLYSTLEPCTHTGKTPPCCEAIIQSGIRHVVWASDDPNDHVRINPAKAVLAKAGISVISGVLDAEARLLSPGLFHKKNRPYITVKLAQSLDGKLALDSGDSAYITGQAARHFVHQLRHESDAILVGSRTVWHDNPELTVRHIPGTQRPNQQPAAVILSGQYDTVARLQSTKLMQANRPVYCLIHNDNNTLTNCHHPNIKLIGITGHTHQAIWQAITTALYQRGIKHVFIEGGRTVIDSLLQAGPDLLDELIIMTAPCIMGGQYGWGQFPSPDKLDAVTRLTHRYTHHFAPVDNHHDQTSQTISRDVSTIMSVFTA